MRFRKLQVEAFIGEEVFITGIYGSITLHELKDIEKEIGMNYAPSNDWDNWRDVLIDVTYEDGGRHDPSYWLVKELGSKPANPSVSRDLAKYLLQFGGEL